MKKHYIYPIVESQDCAPMHSLCDVSGTPQGNPADYTGEDSKVAGRKLYV